MNSTTYRAVGINRRTSAPAGDPRRPWRWRAALGAVLPASNRPGISNCTRVRTSGRDRWPTAGLAVGVQDHRGAGPQPLL